MENDDELEDIIEEFCGWFPEYIKHLITEDLILGTHSRAMDLLDRGYFLETACDIAISECLFSLASKNLVDTLTHAGLMIVDIPLEKEVKEALKLKVPPKIEQH